MLAIQMRMRSICLLHFRSQHVVDVLCVNTSNSHLQAMFFNAYRQWTLDKWLGNSRGRVLIVLFISAGEKPDCYREKLSCLQGFTLFRGVINEVLKEKS